MKLVYRHSVTPRVPRAAATTLSAASFMVSVTTKLNPESAPRVAASLGASAPAGGRGGSTEPGINDVWYGFYPNGREVLLEIETVSGRDVSAVYAIGPGIDKDEPAEWSHRRGHINHRELVFQEKGESTLRARPLGNVGLSVTWVSPDGGTKMEAGLRRLDPTDLPLRTVARADDQGQ